MLPFRRLAMLPAVLMTAFALQGPMGPSSLQTRRPQSLPRYAPRLMVLPEFAEVLRNPAGAFEQAAGIDFIQQMTQQLSSEMNTGQALRAVSDGAETGVVLESVGRDLLVFLAASVFVTPASAKLGVTPILGYLLIGALLGPHGLDMFSNSEADLELGDFGILFLLFSEGLEVSAERLKSLATFLPLGLAQISLTTLVVTSAILFGAPEALDRFLPLDSGLIDVHNPPEAVVLALAGTLSTSAFVFPVLKEKGWESQKSGQAATSILLLQDLAVAPLLVVMPYIVGQGSTDPIAITLLTLKATLGFGAVLFAGSLVLRKAFSLVAETRSSETFVALCLLVSVGMGAVAKDLGLTDTAGAFAAGVLLANTNYRAQIQADILPFKGILLGIFFMDAGSSFDVELALTEWPTILTGTVALVLLKAGTLMAATRVPRWLEPNRLPAPDGLRLSLLLSGGGEFAFVVLALAEKLKVLPVELGGVLTAIVLITMAATPLLGDVAEQLANKAAETGWDRAEGDSGYSEGFDAPPLMPATSSSSLDSSLDSSSDSLGELDECLLRSTACTEVAPDAVVVCGWGDVGQSVAAAVDALLADTVKLDFTKQGENSAGANLPQNVAFSTRPEVLGQCEIMSQGGSGSGGGGSSSTVVCYGDGANPAVLAASGVETPRAVFVTYAEHERCVSAVARLRGAFKTAPIFSRAQSHQEARALALAGATEVVVESDELPRAAAQLLQSTGTQRSEMGQPVSATATFTTPAPPAFQPESFQRGGRREGAGAGSGRQQEGRTRDEIGLIELYQSMDRDGNGLLDREELRAMLATSNSGVASDSELREMGAWLDGALAASVSDLPATDFGSKGGGTGNAIAAIDFVEFCRLVRKLEEFQEAKGRGGGAQAPF